MMLAAASRQFTQRLTAALIVAIVLAGVAITIYSERAYAEQKRRELATEAQVLASIVPAALAFDDRTAAQAYLDAFRRNPEIVAAGLYRKGGALFAGFAASPALAPPPQAPEQAFEGELRNRIVATARVEEKGELLGSVLLISVLEPFAARLTRYGGLTLLVAMALVTAGILLAANRALDVANRALSLRADELAAANRRLVEESVQREKAEAQLRQAQKMEAIGQLTGGIAHDFNNLLTIVLGNLERARRRLGGSAGAEDLSAAIDAAAIGAQRAANLTKSLLAFARRQPLNFRVVDVNALIADLSALLRRTLGEQIDIEFVRGAGLWNVSIDPNQLENAILNLAINARDAMPEGGKLTIETANAYLDAAYAEKVGDIRPGQYVAVCVSDTGPGISAELFDRVFEPFFTTKGEGHGTGLGLAQVYGFVKQSGGHIKLYSEEGHGLTVKMYFPRELRQIDSSAPPRRAAMASAGSGRKVLVVEDEPQVREHTTLLVAELGYQALSAADAAAALQILDAHSDIDVLFTDVGLPGGMTGRQLADEAARRRPSIRVLYTTGYARNAIVHNNRLDPDVHLVTKPFTADDVARALSAVLETETKGAVLVVEDEFLIADLTVSDLKELGYEAISARDGAAAIAAAEQEGRRLYAAVIDLGLPDRRGEDVATDLRRIAPDLRIVFATGDARSAARERFRDDPHATFLSKPYDKRSLAAALEKVA
jgi:signal transduction histidine kinase/DNA-binding response OmpR family regulator